MEKWIVEAREKIKDEADFAYKLCEDTASKLHLELDWVTDMFAEEFRRISKDGRNNG